MKHTTSKKILFLLFSFCFLFSVTAQDEFSESDPIISKAEQKVLLLQFEALDKKIETKTIKPLWGTTQLIENDELKKELSDFLLVAYCSIGKFKNYKKHAKKHPTVKKTLKTFYTNCESCLKLRDYKCKLGYCQKGMQINLASGKKTPCPSCHKLFANKCTLCKKRVRYFSKEKAKDYVTQKSEELQKIIINNDLDEYIERTEELKDSED